MSRLTPRRLRVLVDGLPPESMTKTAIRDTLTSEDFENAPAPLGWGAWSRTDELLAVLADRVSWLIHATYAVNNGKPDEPEPIRRPGVGKSAAEIRALRRQQQISAAHLVYLAEHNGAAPPPGWDHGVPEDEQ